MKITKTKLPETSFLKNVPFDYLDCYIAEVKTKDLEIEKVGKLFFLSGPSWITALLLLRDKLVGFLGLKTGRDASDKQRLIANFKCEIGEQIALFKVFGKNPNEVLFGENDIHLDFRVSLFLDRSMNTITISTHVKFNNWMGKLYFIPVMPFHKIIVPVILKGIVKNLQQSNSL
jgi:hypothetical protein